MAVSPHAGKPHKEEQPLWIIDLGRRDYGDTWSLQKRLVRSRLEQSIPDVLLLLEHEPVFTMGRKGCWEHVLLTRETLQARDMACIATDRGGDVTYHGPGQLVAYPIVQVPGEGRKVRALVQGFEEVLLQTLARFGVQGRTVPKNPGVWVGKAKVASIGIAVRQGISFHGFSLNTDMDLTPFSWIQPCGQPGLSMTSLRELLGRKVPLREVKEIVASLFMERMSYRATLPEGAQVQEATALGLPCPEARFRHDPEDGMGWLEPDRSPEGSRRG